MKLKYYLRGLGIGIVVTVIVMMAALGNRQPMTDEEIKARAAELGMIENSVLADISIKDDDSEKEPEQLENVKTDKEPDTDPEDVKTDKEPDTDPEEDIKQEEDISKGDSDGTQDDKQDVAEQNKDTVSITVVSGDSSWTVSKRMEEAGLIESAKDFDTHLCRYGYDKKISVGTYKIPKTATHEEMAKILTKMD